MNRYFVGCVTEFSTKNSPKFREQLLDKSQKKHQKSEKHFGNESGKISKLTSRTMTEIYEKKFGKASEINKKNPAELPKRKTPESIMEESPGQTPRDTSGGTPWEYSGEAAR